MKILGPNETGKGILIEYDAGFINPKSMDNHFIMESKSFLDHSKPFEFYAVLQKYDTPNRNGRIYPEKILKRESENYKKMMGRDTDSLNASFGFDATKVNFVILSHAHIDHSGLLPKLAKEGFKGNIYCTPATKALTEILLEDSAMIQRDDAKYGNKRRARQGLPPIEPLYDMDDVNIVLPLLTIVEYNQPTKISNSVELLFTDAGHIIGSAAVSLKIKEGTETKTLTFSGDVTLFKHWAISFNSGYDMSNPRYESLQLSDFGLRDFTTTNIGLHWDLHCWEFSANYVPFGQRQSYMMQLNIKSALLQDLKIQRRGNLGDPGYLY
jgi:glyoxylase-like metal-dependent hydrolase (beta-lactamase superfamily II)